MTWEDLGPEGEVTPGALTTVEVAIKWGISDTQSRARLKRLESKGLVRRVKTIRRDEKDHVYYCWGWLIVDEHKGP